MNTSAISASSTAVPPGAVRAKKSYVSPFILKANQLAKERSKNALKVLRSVKGGRASGKGEWNERIFKSESGLFDPSIKKVEIFKIEPKVSSSNVPVNRMDNNNSYIDNTDNKSRLTRNTQSEYISPRHRSSRRSTIVKFLNNNNDININGPGDLTPVDEMDYFDFDTDEIDYTTAGELSPDSDSPLSALQGFKRMVTRSTSPIDERIVRALVLDEVCAAPQAEAQKEEMVASSTGAVAASEADLCDADDEGEDDAEDFDTSLVDMIAPYQNPGLPLATRDSGGGSPRDVLMESFMRMLDVMTEVMAGDGSRRRRSDRQRSNSPLVLLSQNRLSPRASPGEEKDSGESEESSSYDESTFEQQQDGSVEPPAAVVTSRGDDKMIRLILEKLDSVEKTEGRLMEMLSKSNSDKSKGNTSSSSEAAVGNSLYSSARVTKTPRDPAVHLVPLVSDRLNSNKIDELSSRYAERTTDLLKYTSPFSGSTEQATAGLNLRAPLPFRTFETSLNITNPLSSRSVRYQEQEQHEIIKTKHTEELKKGLYIDNIDSAGGIKKKLDGANRLYSVRDRKKLDRISFLPRVTLAYERRDAIVEHKAFRVRDRELREFVVRSRTGQTLCQLGDVVAAKIFEECVDEVCDQVEEFLSDYAERFIDKI